MGKATGRGKRCQRPTEAPATPRADSAAGLTPKQARFVDEYMIDLNATGAARRAGYSAKTAEVQGPRLLGNVRVKAAVDAGLAAKAAESGHSQKRVLDELAALAYSDVRHFRQNETTGDLELAPGAPDNAWRAVSSVKFRMTSTPGSKAVSREVEFRLWDKPGSLKLAGRHVATPGFFDKIEHTGEGGGAIRSEVHYYIPDNGRARK